MKIHFNKTLYRITLACSFAMTLTACNGFFDKDNTPAPSPLVSFHETLHPQLVWETQVNSGLGSDYVKLVPALSNTAIFTADKNGTVTATNKTNGAALWHVSTDDTYTSGPALDDSRVYIGSRSGKVIALQQSDGKVLWTSQVSSEVLAPPAASQGIVVVKTIDGRLVGLSAQDGHLVWHYQQVEPSLILRSASAPQIENDHVIAGFANGTLAKLSLQNGSTIWQEAVAIPTGTFAIQRMIDIDADPDVLHNKIFVATYQGRISALELSSAKTLWTHDLSSFTGLTVQNDKVFVSDAKSYLWAFDANSGTVAWRQTQLESRTISAPVSMGNTIVVGDAEGYLHWLNPTDGHFEARMQLGGAGILATPAVDNGTLYVLTQDGHLAALRLG